MAKHIGWNKYVQLVLLIEALHADKGESFDTIQRRESIHREAMEHLESEGVKMPDSWKKPERE